MMGPSIDWSFTQCIGGIIWDPHKAFMGGQQVVVLIDCGAMHNFISPDLTEGLDLEVSTTPNHGVWVRNGKTHVGQAICKRLHLQWGELYICEDFLPMPMRSSNIILRMKWLASVGETHDDWKKLTMTTTVNSGEIVGHCVGQDYEEAIKAREWRYDDWDVPCLDFRSARDCDQSS